MALKITKTTKNNIVMKGVTLLLLSLVLIINKGYSQCTGNATNAATQNWSTTSFGNCGGGSPAVTGGIYNGSIEIAGLGSNETLNFNINKNINGNLTFLQNGGGAGDEAIFIVKSGTTLNLTGLKVGRYFKLIVEVGATVTINGEINADDGFIMENYGTINSTSLKLKNNSSVTVYSTGYLNLNTSDLIAGNNLNLEINGKLKAQNIKVGDAADITINDGAAVNVAFDLTAGKNVSLNINEDVQFNNITLGNFADINVNNGAILKTTWDLKTGSNAEIGGDGTGMMTGGGTINTGGNSSVETSHPSINYQYCTGSAAVCAHNCSPNSNISVGAAGNITGTNSVCPGQTGVTYRVDAINNARSYSWTVPTGATITAGNGTNQITVSFASNASNGNVTVRGVACNSTGASRSFAVTVKPLPTLTNVPTNSTICVASSVAQTNIATSNGATISWTNSNTAIGLAASGNGQVPAFTATNTTTAPITATIHVTATLNGCVNTSSYTITVDALPQVANVERCGPGYVTFSSVPGTYRGYREATGSAMWGQITADEYTMEVPISMTIYVTKVNGSCESPRVPVTVTIKPLPAAPGVTPTSVCKNSGATVSVTVGATGKTSAEDYKWYSAATGGTLLQTDGASLTRTISNTTTYYVSKYNNTTGCEGPRTAVTATVNTYVTAPNITITRDVTGTICPGKSVIFTATSVSGGTYQWKIGTTNVGTNSRTFTTSNLKNGDVVTCTFTPNGACPIASTSNTLTIAVTPQNTWSGASSSDWNNVANWCGSIPTIDQDVIIPGGLTRYPVISGTASTRNITVASGATLTFSSGAQADFRGNAVINGNWVENGHAAITIGGNADFSNANSKNDLQSLSSLRIEGQLTFPQNGKIIVAPSGLLTLGINATYSGSSDTKFVEGKMRKIFASTTQFVFPVGAGVNAGKIAVAPEQASPQSSFTINYFRADPKVAVNDHDRTSPADPDYLFKVSDVEYWTFESTGGVRARVSLSWGQNSYVNENGDLSDLRVAYYNQTRSVWQALPTMVDGTGIQTMSATAGSISTVDPISVQGTLTVGTTSPVHTLPVALSKFELVQTEGGVEVKWQTTSESNNSGYEIQRSFDGFKSFEKAGFVKGKGTTSEMSSYTFTDHNVMGSIVFYRLKQIDLNGEFKLSEVKYLEFGEENLIPSIYPNPTLGEVVIVLKDLDKEAKVSYSIIGADGRVRVLEKNIAGIDINARVSNSISSLKNGTYTILLTTSKNKYSFRVIKI